MKLKNTLYIIIAACFCLASCDEFLDVMPDNRTELDNKEKIQSIITAAYPVTDYLLLTSFSSDDVDDFGPENPNTDRFIEQVVYWEDITERDNESDENLWDSSYGAIAAANQAIEAIEEMGDPVETGYTAELAEALLCRAYNHFVLVNVFAMAYNSQTSATDPGVTYMLKPEQGLDPKYERNTVADVYENIEKDLTRALPWVNDSYYKVPKYHFNQKAAYAFAARFYLYYEKYDESIKYADACLGTQPASMLRDWKYQASMTQDEEVITEHFISSSLNANLMLITAYSKMGRCFVGNYGTYSKFASGNYLASREGGIALATLLGSSNSAFYYSPMKVYKATNHDKTSFWRLPYLFEYKDPVAGTGWYRTVYPAFTSDHVLLERAEAKLLNNQYDSAVEDMNIWLNNISKAKWNLSAEEINDLMAGVEYSTWNNSTVKKHIEPLFEVSEGIQENLIQFCLLLKRVEGYSMGLRWFDVKRYGIAVERREMGADGNPLRLNDTLEPRDPRRALQVPKKVIDAGYEPNVRR